MTQPMTLARFNTIGKRDWENGAVQDELHAAVAELERLRSKKEEYHRAVGEAVEFAAQELPEDWEIIIEIGPGSGDVKLKDNYGDHRVFPESYESLHDSVREAVAFAKDEDMSE